MSLADQQWCPTSVQVTVLQARGLRIKGKSGTNDAYAVMQVAKEKYQTSVMEKSVAPVWKEEAAFDLPQLQQAGGGTERSTLRVHVLHRALVGPDKLLGQAVINLLQLSEDRARNKTEWFKLLDKTGKADKDRGEVLVDIQFMRNNMTASMFDLSAAGKSRSRLGKFKDKVRGKKKESDSASSVVPSFNQVLTDSEEEGNEEGEVAAAKDEKKKKPKIKSLFSPKSNLQRNMSQSMSVLPAKNSSLSGSQSSGLNVDSSEGKKKFKFKIHKRSGSSDSKDSSSGHQKHGAPEQSNLCINGSHIYCEEPQARTSRIGSNYSLASSGHGSMDDVPESSPPSVDSLRAVRQYSPWTEEEEEETETAEVENVKEDVDELRREEEERIRIEEERRRREEEEERVRRQEEVERLAEEKRRLEEEERRRIEEEEKRQREEEERMEEERRRQEEEWKLAEEKKRLEEEERRRIDEERVRKEQEERIRREEEERAQEERRRQEEERERLTEEKRRLEEQQRRIEEEEKRKREEEERIRREEEMALEERRRQEEECERLAEEKSGLEEQQRRIEEEEKRKREEQERIRREEEMALEERRRQEDECERLAEEKSRLEEQEKRIEEEERIRREKEMALEETRRQEEEERARRQEEERLEEQERRRIEAEEKKQREEEERIRKEHERVLEERRRQEDEEMVRRQIEEREEKRRLEEQERKRREEEERIKKEEEEKAWREKEEYERLEEEKRKLEEEESERIEAEEKIKKEEEERVRMEEERKRKEEEEVRARRQEEEQEKLAEEKRILEEQERRRIKEEEKRQREEEERIRKEEKRKEEEERARKEKEEYERLVEEKMRQEKERRRIEEEERIRQEEQERIRMEKERRRQEEEEKKIIEEEEEKIKREERIRREEKAEEQARKLEKVTRNAEEEENKTKDKASDEAESAAEVTSTNPFDENFSMNPFDEDPNSPAGPNSSTDRVSPVKQRSQSAVSSLGSKAASTDEKDLISTQREKRPAPQPPGRNQAERRSQREQDESAQHLPQISKQSKDKDVKTASVLPQRSVQMIAPLSRPPTEAKNTQSLTQSTTTKGTTNVVKHSKRPAPSRPGSVEEGPSSGPKTASSSGDKIANKFPSEAKQKPIVYGLNPFEDDEDELAAQDDTTNIGSVQWPPPMSQAAEKDAASQAKIKSSKMARAPPLPAKKDATSGTSIKQNTEGGRVTDDAGVVVPDNSETHPCDPEPVQETPVQESQHVTVQSARGEGDGNKEGTSAIPRRLQPVKPLNPLGQQSVSVVQGEIDNKSTGIHSEVQEKTKVNGTGPKGPYSQLTREELISLVLRQENQLSRRDSKISELEQYIDNLLVRVIEEKPSILMSMNSLKKPV